jgi:glutathione S-transferase
MLPFTETTSSVLLGVFATVLVLLAFKAQLLAAATAAARGRLGKFINEEDAAWLGGVHANPDDERVQRIFRSHRNDLEALLPFFIVGGVYLASGASRAVGVAYCIVFLLARFTHTVAYLRRRPRLRRDAFTAAWLTNFAMGAHGLWAVLAG